MSEDNLIIRYRTIERFPNYRFGDDGSVWSKFKVQWRQLKPRVDRRKRIKVALSMNGQRVDMSLPHLILEAFVSPRPNGLYACHFPDKDTTNNRADNLMWGTAKQNKEHEVVHGTRMRGEKHHKAKLTESQVKEIRRLWATKKYRRKALATMFNMSEVQIGIIVQRRQWKHI